MAATVPAGLGFRRSAVLLGDSITQNGAGVDGWAAAIAHAAIRKVDVLNRGLSGYTTRSCLAVLPYILPKSTTGLFATVFFGANDSASNYQQHVPLEQYEANLGKIVDAMLAWAPHVVVISPPPVVEIDRPTRSNERIRQYAQAAQRVANAKSCPFINLIAIFEARHDWHRLLCDGLHLSAEGNTVVAEAVLSVVTPWIDKIATDVPLWADTQPEDSRWISAEAVAKLPYACGQITHGPATN